MPVARTSSKSPPPRSRNKSKKPAFVIRGSLSPLFLFIALANLFTIVPGYAPPTSSLSTTAALALCVFVAVPVFGIRDQGLSGYLRSYVRPTVIMLPFNIISEFSRTLALAVRLFGNMMSGTMIIATLLTITPFILPISMTLLGLPGMVQAYIFAILATVYIAAPTTANPNLSQQPNKSKEITWTPDLCRNRFHHNRGITTSFGCMAPALGEGRSVATALTLAQQPDASATITRTLFVGLAMIESTAIYCFVVSMILIFRRRHHRARTIHEAPSIRMDPTPRSVVPIVQ